MCLISSRCLGSTQHLKNKYGSGYLLEVKLSQSSAELNKSLQQLIFRLIPGYEQLEHFQERATYKIAQAGVSSIAEIFRAIEERKYYVIIMVMYRYVYLSTVIYLKNSTGACTI